MVYVFGLLAACLLGFGFVLQQQAAARAPTSEVLSFRLLLDLVRVPLWLGGIGFMVAGQILGGIALLNGDITRVEPLLATNLLFALLLARRFSDQQLGRAGWLGAVLLSGGVAVFVIAGAPHGAEVDVSAVRHWAVFGSVIALAAVLTLTARHLRILHEATVATGCGFGLTAALIKGVTQVFSDGFAAVFTNWQLYAMIASGAGSMFLLQSALNSGRLLAAQPGFTLADPVVSVAWGVFVFDEKVRTGLFLVLAGVCAVLVGAATIVLTRSPLLSGEAGRSDTDTDAEDPGQG
jgi:drug/metabolite transporter (DMT)-like permease